MAAIARLKKPLYIKEFSLLESTLKNFWIQNETFFSSFPLVFVCAA